MAHAVGPGSGDPVKRTLLTRAILGLAVVNFVLAVWFAQYITTGWLIYTYVIGSFVLMGAAMVVAE
jgi:hypothetical protein